MTSFFPGGRTGSRGSIASDETRRHLAEVLIEAADELVARLDRKDAHEGAGEDRIAGRKGSTELAELVGKPGDGGHRIAENRESLEKVTGSGGSIQWNLYVRVGDRLVAQRIDYTPPGGGASSIAMRYFTTDHLGSVAVITDELGAVVERLSFDAWGKRRHPDGTDDPSGSITSQTTRGFTGHEMIDEVGLVNMNGRVYDPEIGRFMSADPFVQDPTNTQSLNRYSYVGNNPLSYTDPSGYFLKKIWKALVAIVVAVIFMQPWMISAIGTALGTTGIASTIASAAIGGAIAGGIVGGGNLRSILTGAISGAAFAGLGGIDFTSAGLGAEVMAYGMTGGITSVIGGGEFQSGFLAAGFAALAGPDIAKFADKAGKGTASVVAGTAASAVAGGIGSVLGGGKFENGAVTGAFAYAVGRAMGPSEGDDWGSAKGKYAANDNGTMSDVFAGDHGYPAGPNLICSAEKRCSAAEVASEYSKVRSGIPGNTSAETIKSGQVYTVYQNGVPVGQVRSYVGVDGLTVVNVTEPNHILFDGWASRRAYQSADGAWYSVTHGSGTNYYGGAFMAAANQILGPVIFNKMDNAIAERLGAATR